MAEGRAVEQLWWSDAPAARAARGALLPLSWLFGGVVRARGAGYDRGVLPAEVPALPAISVGNLTVGGTGKTPVAAWIAGELRRRGERPAIVLRGYGADEPLVHATLNPEVLVVVDPDRVAGVRDAAARGATIAVLDDAFQHRRCRRDADVVLVSADRWDGRVHLLPAGPFREPLAALRRATIAVVTRKAAGPDAVDAVCRAIAATAPSLPVAVAQLAPDVLVRVGGHERRPLATLAGARALAIAAIGDPGAFLAQLERAGARTTARLFPDHHAFGEAEIAALAREAAAYDAALCTLKDAVKLAPGWPAGAPALWYVSQRVVVERGRDELDLVLDGVRHARDSRARTAG